jgi:hypothetical protein
MNEYRITRSINGRNFQVEKTPKLREDCYLRDRKDQLVEGEFALTQMRQPQITYTGDLCESDLVIRFHRWAGDWSLREDTDAIDKERYTDPAYPFYVNSHADTQFEETSIERAIPSIFGVIERQCGTVPTEVVVLGILDNDPGWGQNPKFMKAQLRNLDTYQPFEFYSGKVIRNSSGNFRWLHDHPDIAETTIELALDRKAQRQAHIAKRQQLLSERRRRASLGAAYFMLLLAGIHESSICNQPGLSSADKRIHECF